MATDREKRREWMMRIGAAVAAAGACIAVRGVALAWRPGGWMLAGVLIAAPGLFVAYDAFRGR